MTNDNIQLIKKKKKNCFILAYMLHAKTVGNQVTCVSVDQWNSYKIITLFGNYLYT